jgi:hypothetical protein
MEACHVKGGQGSCKSIPQIPVGKLAYQNCNRDQLSPRGKGGSFTPLEGFCDNRGHCQYCSNKTTASFAKPAIALPPSHSTNKKTLPIVAMRAKYLIRTFRLATASRARFRSAEAIAASCARSVPSKPVRNFGVPNPAVSPNRQQAPKDHSVDHRRACNADRSFKGPLIQGPPYPTGWYRLCPRWLI